MSHELDPLRDVLGSWGGKTEHSFALSYGSSVSGSPTSDLDMLIISDSLPKRRQQDQLVDGLLLLHEQSGRAIDFEVPYDNKIFYTFDDLDDVLALPFMAPGEPGRIDIKYLDQASDEDPYFCSREMRLRLLFNALTSSREFLTGSEALYGIAEVAAHDRLVRLITHLQSGDPRPTAEILAISQDNIGGKDYLGYFVPKPSTEEI